MLLEGIGFCSMKHEFDDKYYIGRILTHCLNIEDFNKRFDGSYKVLLTDLCRTRDKITHHYDGIDKELVWEIVSVNIPELKVYCEKIYMVI